MAAQAIGSLYAQLGLDSASFDAGIANARKKLNEFGKVNFSGALKAGFGELDDMLKGAAGQAGALGNVLSGLGITGAAAGAAIAVAFAGARDAMAFGDEIADTANKLRVTTDYLQEMRFVAHQLGGDFKDADDALSDFGKALGLARSGLSAKAVKPFTALGLDPKDFTTVEAGLKAVTAKIAGLSNAAEQAAVADKLGLTPLLPAIREGTAAIDDMRKAAQTIGYVMDAQLIEKAGAANDQYEALTQVLNVQFKSAMVSAIPAVMKLTEFMVSGAKAAGWFADRLDDAAKFGAMIGSLDPFAQADIQEAKKYDAERKRRMAAAKADFMQPGAVGAASSLSGWLGTGREDPTTQLRNLINEQTKASAASRASAKAERDAAAAARERAAALKEIADAMRAAEDRSADYAASLLEEISTMGMSSEALKRRQIALEAAAAPTQALADQIRALGAQYEAQKKVETESVAVQKQVQDQQNETIRTIQDAIGSGIEWSTTLEDLADRLWTSADRARDLAYDIEDIARAINDNDWTSAFAGLASVLLQVEKAFAAGATSATKFAAVAGVAQGVGSIVGGSGGAALGGAASGAMAGFTVGGPIGAAIGGVLGGLGGLFGSSKAKKQAKAQAAAQKAAEEAARRQQIDDTTFSLNVALLEAQGKAEEALAMTRQRELDALAKLDPSLVSLQQQLYAAQDAADAAAKAAEAQAQADAMVAKAKASQRSIILDLMAMDDAVTGGNSAVLAARQLELAALDPVSRALKEIYFARLDEGEALAKQAAAQEAAQEAMAKAAQAEIEATARNNELWSKSTQEALDRVSEAAQRQADAMKSVLDSVADSITGLQGLSKSLREFSDALGAEGLAGTDPARAYANARAAFDAAIASQNAEATQSTGRALIEAARLSGDSLMERRAIGIVRGASLGLANTLDSRVSGIGALFSSLPRFANGGSMSIGGNPGIDQNILSLNGAPMARVGYGETLSVTPAGGAANDNGWGSVVAELRSLRVEVASLRAEAAKTADSTKETHDLLRNGTIAVTGG